MSENRKFPIPPEVRESFKQFAEQATGWHLKDTHIKKISVRKFSSRIKKQITSDICEGKELDMNLSNIPHEPVLAIFEADQSNEYFVVTPDMGRFNKTVYLFEPQEVLEVEKEG
ncbi:MAG: hypothetical protein WAW67_06000 [Candidatus Omnitrophota bacterium]